MPQKHIKKLLLLILILFPIILLAVFSFHRFYFYNPKNSNWLKNNPIFHRGLHDGNSPENSLSAFENAIANGFTIELDVVPTKDNIPMVIHDENTKRLTNKNYDIRNTNYADLKNLKLQNTNEHIPTLKEALDLVKGRVPLLIDIKNTGMPGKLEKKVYELLDKYSGNFAIQSNNPFVCSWFLKNMPDVLTGIIYNDVAGINNSRLRFIRDNIFSLVCRPNFVTYRYSFLEEDNLNKERQMGLIVLGFSIPAKDTPEKNLNQYADNLIIEVY